MNSAEILKITNTQLNLLGSGIRLNTLPKVPLELQLLLEGKKLLLVDDSLEWLEHWLPKLQLATKGAAHALLHRRGISAEELCKSIIELMPDYILLDYCLAGGLKGKDLIARIQHELPTVIIFGFSSLFENNKKLIEAGAKAAFDKAALDSNQILSEITEFMNLQESI